MPRYDLTEFLEDGSVTFDGVKSPTHPDGKSYTFASPSFAVGLHLTHMFEFAIKARLGVALADDDANRLILNDDEEKDLYRQVMGGTYDELSADQVPWTAVQKMFSLLFQKHAASQDIDAALAGPGEPEAPEDGAAQVPVKRTAGGRSRRASGATASQTKTQASRASSTSLTGPEAATAI